MRRAAIVALLAAAGSLLMGAMPPAIAADVLTFEVDPAWPKPLPNDWIMGQAAGVAVDAQDHIWVIQRPKTLTDDEKAASLNPPRTKCCMPAPPVLEFDQAGNLVKAWGGPGEGYDWPQNEHGIYIDHKGFVWLAGNGDERRPDPEIHARRQIRAADRQARPADEQPRHEPARPAGRHHGRSATNEVYVADGYYNHRIIVFDAETGAFKRHWGAYGKPPTDEKLAALRPRRRRRRSSSATRCIACSIAKDGLVYVCDRTNDRIQVFHKDGSFVKEFFVEKNTLANGSVWDLALGPTRTRRFLINADGANNEVRTLVRETGEIVGAFGRNGRMAGEFHWVHNLAIDSKATCSPPRSTPASGRRNSCSGVTPCSASARRCSDLCHPQPGLSARGQREKHMFLSRRLAGEGGEGRIRFREMMKSYRPTPICSIRHCAGALSGRHLSRVVPWRNRLA